MPAASLSDVVAYLEVMSDAPDDVASEDDVVDQFMERRDLDEDSWIEDGEKYRCPECGAVHEDRADGCRVCGWERA